MFISKTPFRVPLAGGGTDLSFIIKKMVENFSHVPLINSICLCILRKFNKNSLIQTTNVEFVRNNEN